MPSFCYCWWASGKCFVFTEKKYSTSFDRIIVLQLVFFSINAPSHFTVANILWVLYSLILWVSRIKNGKRKGKKGTSQLFPLLNNLDKRKTRREIINNITQKQWGNNTLYLSTLQCSPGNPWILAFMWMLFLHAPATNIVTHYLMEASSQAG